MASKQANVDFVIEQMSEAGDVTARKMFGEYGIYRGGKVVALFCDDQLFVKPTDAGRAFIGKVKEAPPYPGAKPWFLISGDLCEDAEWLSELVRITTRELPTPKPKSASKSATKPKPAQRAKPKPRAKTPNKSATKTRSRRA